MSINLSNWYIQFYSRVKLEPFKSVRFINLKTPLNYEWEREKEREREKEIPPFKTIGEKMAKDHMG